MARENRLKQRSENESEQRLLSDAHHIASHPGAILPWPTQSKDIDVAEQMLKLGKVVASDSFSDAHLLKNLAKGGYAMDFKGSGAQLSGARRN